ncbi:MAG: BMP family ABC transporter substrate-binding protein [Acholeplasma sp.]|nr:BMP family ABC transporter substrate-binding protein [Acholeplasma sp.]
MKKLFSVLAIVMVAFALVSCGGKKYEIALITDKGNIDDKSFNQGSWEGVEAFVKNFKDADGKDYTHKYYKPETADDSGYLSSISQAIKNGAKVVVTPGFLFEVAVKNASKDNPDVKFILIDTVVEASNVASIMYAEEQSGFLAGYAAVKDGLRKLGFMGGMAVPAVQAFGYGYLQGAEYAAKELELANGAITAQYHYTGDFAETTKNKGTANTMYQDGMEVIFASGGSVGKSVMSAAKEQSKKVIGVDVDQRYDDSTVITSATKGLSASVEKVLESIYKTNTWATYAGKTTRFDVVNNGVGLPTTVIGDANGNAFDRFTSFNLTQYNTIYAKLVNDKALREGILKTITVADESGIATAKELTDGLSLTKVTVKVIA